MTPLMATYRPPSTFCHNEQCLKELEARKELSTTVYGLQWSPKLDDNCTGGRYLVACSSFGVVCIWDILGDGKDERQEYPISIGRRQDKSCLSLHYSNNDFLAKSNPIVRFQACVGALYDLKFHHINGKQYLIVSGNIGVLVYQWEHVLAKLDEAAGKYDSSSSQEESDLSSIQRQTTTIHVAPVSNFKTHPSVTERQGVEVNCVSCDERNGILYGAAGDLFGCYQWNLSTGQLIQTLSGGVVTGFGSASSSSPSSHTDFLHSVRALSDGSATVLTGGEDGKFGIWDGKEGKLIEMIDCRSAMNKGKLSNQSTDWQQWDREGGNRPSSKTNSHSIWGPGHHLWVSGIDVDSGCNWAAVCGGAEGGGGNNASRNGSASDLPSNAGGFVTLWSLRTRSLVAGSATRENVQAVSYSHAFDRMVTTGNEPIVSFRSRTDIQPQERAWLSSPSGFAIAVNEENGVMAVGGASRRVDLFTDVGNKTLSMTFV